MEVKTTGGPPICILHGAIYHHCHALFPVNITEAKYAQIYLYDHADATRRRLDILSDLDPKVLDTLGRMLDKNSPLVHGFKQMRDLANEFLAAGRHNVSLGFAASTDSDMRRYNHPAKEEVAAVFVADSGAPPGNRDMVLWPRDPKTPVYRVDDMNEHVDPCTYALLFPHGELGWHPKLLHKRETRTVAYIRISPMQFYAYRLMVRDEQKAEGELHPLPHAGRTLFQQYIVDAYCRAEAQRLR